MNRKGAMQLSINMIVILIIAVVILGLALGFINGMFGSMANQFDPDEPEAAGAKASTPITMSRGSGITASAGEELTIKWQAFCTLQENCTGVHLDNITCSELTIDDTLEKDIAYGKSEQIMTLIKVSSSATGTSLCTATFTDEADDYSKSLDFSLKVN